MNNAAKILRAEFRFWGYIGPSDANECWPWVGPLTNTGYGKFSLNRKSLLAHRYAYRMYKSDIAKGLTIDHLCRNRTCVNPSHMEVVSMKVNVLRGIGPSAINSRKTQCPQGHEYNPENTYVSKEGFRHCWECLKANEIKSRPARLEYFKRKSKERRDKKKAAGG